LPGISYLAITHDNFPLGLVIKSAIGSVVAWIVFIVSFFIFLSYSSIRFTKNVLMYDGVVISLGLLLLPVIFPAISARYQNEVRWGAGTLPVYYQNFGLAYFIAWALTYTPCQGKIRFIIPLIMSLYLSLNVTVNSKMVKSIDMAYREPRDAFVIQAQSGLFNNVQDGDIIQVKNVAHYINENLIFEWTGKRVYVPTSDHTMYKEVPDINAKRFDLSRSSSTVEHSYEIYPSLVLKDPNEFMLSTSNVELLHIGYQSGELGNGIELPPISFANHLSIEILIKPYFSQNPNAEILSNHWNYRGIAIEQVNNELNHYVIAFGNGKNWMDVGKLTLRPNEISYISLQVKDLIVNIYINGQIVAHTDLPEPIAKSPYPLYLGNWKGGGRKFQGWIEEVLISSDSKSENQVSMTFDRMNKAGVFSSAPKDIFN
jgi:hypothetical protein